jgi:predicted nucleotidyltransferase
MKTTNDYIQLLRDYKREHAAEYGIERLGIFGSVARGEQTDDSDVDIYI